MLLSVIWHFDGPLDRAAVAGSVICLGHFDPVREWTGRKQGQMADINPGGALQVTKPQFLYQAKGDLKTVHLAVTPSSVTWSRPLTFRSCRVFGRRASSQWELMGSCIAFVRPIASKGVSQAVNMPLRRPDSVASCLGAISFLIM